MIVTLKEDSAAHMPTLSITPAAPFR